MTDEAKTALTVDELCQRLKAAAESGHLAKDSALWAQVETQVKAATVQEAQNRKRDALLVIIETVAEELAEVCKPGESFGVYHKPAVTGDDGKETEPARFSVQLDMADGSVRFGRVPSSKRGRSGGNRRIQVRFHDTGNVEIFGTWMDALRGVLKVRTDETMPSGSFSAHRHLKTRAEALKIEVADVTDETIKAATAAKVEVPAPTPAKK